MLHDRELVGIRLAQNGVQRGDHRHAHVAQEFEQVAARRAAVDAEFVLHRDDFDVVDVQEFRGPPVGIEFLLRQLEAHALGVVIAFRAIVDRAHNALGLGELHRDGLADVGGERGDAATPRHIIAEKGDVFGVGWLVHDRASRGFERLTTAATCDSPNNGGEKP